MSENNAPTISVITVSVNCSPLIIECLRALNNQQGDFNAEIIVVSCCDNETAELIRKNFPNVMLLQFSERLAIPQLRAIGMSHATANIVAVTEDCCIPQEDWVCEIIKAHESGYQAVGGVVEKTNCAGIIDCACYLCEYSHAMLPIPYGEVNGIPGNNASYKREILDKVDKSIKRNYWEFFLHEEMRKLGVKFLSVPTIVVSKRKEFGFLYFLTQRFHYSRSFAGMRRTKIPVPKLLLHALFSPLLPFLMIQRIAKQVVQKKRYRKEFLLSLPVMAVLSVGHALGEFAGYLFGPGNSLNKVE